MAGTTNLRRLRLRYGISLTELARLTGVSNQHISRVELRQTHASARLEARLANALETVVATRKQELALLEADLLKYRGRLLETKKDVTTDEY